MVANFRQNKSKNLVRWRCFGGSDEGAAQTALKPAGSHLVVQQPKVHKNRRGNIKRMVNKVCLVGKRYRNEGRDETKQKTQHRKLIRDHPLRLWDHPGRVQGWESVCWGVLGIPLLENKKRFLGCWSLFFVQFFFMFSKDICYIVPNSHFMLFDRYWSHIHNFCDFI